MTKSERLLYTLHAQLDEHRSRVREARDTVAVALAQASRPSVSCSFGKDSVVLLRLVLDQCPKTRVFYMDSGYALPETYDLLRRLEKEWGFRTDILKQPTDYIALCKRFGLPNIDRTREEQRSIVKMLKKDLGDDWARQNGIDLVFMGLRREESRGRDGYLADSPIIRRKGRIYCYPLRNWTGRDVWAYIVTNDIPYLPMYDCCSEKFPREWLRNTGWLSTDGANRGRLVWLRQYYPRLYARLVDQFPVVRSYT